MSPESYISDPDVLNSRQSALIAMQCNIIPLLISVIMPTFGTSYANYCCVGAEKYLIQKNQGI
jgi:hypothetical protein